MRKTIAAAITVAATIAALAAPAAANATTPATTHRHAQAHQCKPMAAPIRPPVAGYLIGSHSNPAAPLFYRSVDDLTAGLFYPMGGDWVMRYWCTQAATSHTATVIRRTVWGITGYKSINPVATVVWPRKLFGTKAQADAYLTQVTALEHQVCPLAPVSCATFVEAPVIIG